MEDTKLSILPDEVIVQILLRVPLSSFRAINSTCKYWQSILARREFWKYLSKLVWGEKSTPSSDFASATGKTPVIPGDQLVDWKEYFRIRSKLDGIASIINALQKGFTLNLDADLDTKSDVISNYLRDQMVPDLDEDDAVEMLFKMILSCCDHTFSFSSLGVVWLERLPERYFGGLARHPELMPKIIKITDDILQHSTEENQQHVIEFWSSSCDQELDYREGSESHVPTDNSSLFIGSCCKDLVPLLIRAISDEKYAPTELDEDNWTVRQAAETCLQQVTKVVLGDIVPLVEPILRRDLNSEDWKRRDIALEILGLMFTENHYDYIEKNAASYLLQVLESLRFNHVHVRQSAAWALSKICRSYAKEIKVHNTLLSKAVLEALSDILGVRQYIYACIAHYLSEEAENPFEKDFPRLMEALTACMATSHDNSLALYEAIAALATVQEDSEAIRPLIPIVLQGLKQDINAISVTTALTRKYPEVVVPYVDELMTLYLAHMQEEVTEEALIAIGYTAAAIGEGFTKYLPVLMPFILPLLNNAQNTQMFIGTLGLLGDICGSTKAAIIPYCDTIMQSVLTAVSNPAAHRNVRPEIISLLGDIVLAIGGPAYLRYLPFVLQVLKQAGQVIVEEHDDSNIELEEYIAELRNAWFSALSALFQSYRKNKIAAPPLTELIPLILQAVIGTVNASVNSKNASVAIYVVGDIVQTMEQVLATVRKRNGLNECLNLALGSTDESVVEAATWVLKLLKV